MKNIFLALFLTFAFTTLHAEWRDYNELSKDLVIEPMELKNPSKEEWLKIYNASKQFGQRMDRKTPGIHLYAYDRHSTSSVELRFKDDVLDIKIHFDEKNVSGGANKLYVNLLDEDHFLIKSIHIDDITFPFRGILHKSEKFNMNDLENVKFYSFNYRG